MKTLFEKKYGGGGGIRTHEAIADLPVFKTGAFNQALPPLPENSFSPPWRAKNKVKLYLYFY